MVRKLNLIIIMFISLLLIPLPLFARSGHGGGRGGFGHGGFHRGFGGHGFGGHSRLGGHGFRGHSIFGHRGFHSGHGHFGRFHHKHFRHGHHHHRHFSSSFFFGLGFGAVFPFVIYPYYAYPYYGYPYASYPSAAQSSYGDLEIQVAPGDVEIYVDGRFIGLAGDFNGLAIVLVPSGNHVVEFRYNDSSSSTNVYVAPGSKSVVGGEFKPIPQSSKEGVTPPSYRYFPTIYHEESAGLLKLNAEPGSALIDIDGKPLAKAKQIENGVVALPAGSHDIKIAASGYSSYEGKVNITENDVTELRVNLEKKTEDKINSVSEDLM